MKKHVGFGALLIIAGLGWITTVLGSNMGFRIEYLLRSPDGGVTSLTGKNALGLPYRLPFGMTTAKALMDDIGSASVASVARYIESTEGTEVYTGRPGTPNSDFNLVPGEGYYVVMFTNVNYFINGSHDAGVAVLLNRPDGCVTSCTGSNLYSHPYHATATTAKALLDDIGSASVASITRYIRSSDLSETYTGRPGTPKPDFPLVQGEAYVVVMNTTVSYIPSHP
jgi:hypothetical protein